MKRILVALDASPRAPFVLAAAVELARALAGKVRLFRAIQIQPEVPWDMLREFPPGGLEQLLTDEAEVDLRERARTVPSDLLDGVGTGIGVPWRAIRSAASTWSADLVVVGSHGYGVVDRILGTTAASVVHHVRRSVLVVWLDGDSRAANAD
jgi:nucleotide-binding universal stress UspA family protein